MYKLVLGENNAADQTKMMQDQMSGAALSVPDDMNKAFQVNIYTENEEAIIFWTIFFFFKLK